jgi:hypothetical protein
MAMVTTVVPPVLGKPCSLYIPLMVNSLYFTVAPMRVCTKLGSIMLTEEESSFPRLKPRTRVIFKARGTRGGYVCSEREGERSLTGYICVEEGWFGCGWEILLTTLEFLVLVL